MRYDGCVVNNKSVQFMVFFSSHQILVVYLFEMLADFLN